MIVIVEDDDVVAETLTLYLEQAGFRVERAADGVEGLRLASRDGTALVILDLMIPKLPGLDVCSRLRATSSVPILMLTARTSEAARIRGLELGADDYVGKPFSPREIVLRAKALIKRSSSAPAGADPEAVRVGPLEIDVFRRQVRVDGQPVPLTATELKLLEALARYPERAFTRDELLARAFGPDYDGTDRTIDAHITNIRRKLEPHGASQCVMTVHGVGYRLSAGDRD